MICALCGGPVFWRGPMSNLAFTQCAKCGAENSQIPPDEEE